MNPLTPPTAPEELRPLLHAEIDRLPDEEVAVLHRIALELELDAVSREADELFDGARADGLLARLPEIIREARAAIRAPYCAMTVVVDTNAVVQMMGRASPFAALKRALEQGRLHWAVSTPVLMEYEEVICRHAGARAWERVARMIELISALRGTVRQTSPSFRFRTITGDPDDDAFADCAITAEADWIITADHHFDAMLGSGYKPQPITPAEFIQRFLQGV